MPPVLIIDDEHTLAKNIAAYLRRNGFDATVAASGEEALARLAGVRPAAVLVDYALPGITGLDVLDEIKSTIPQVPVIVMTAHAAPKLADEALRRGASDYLTKPIVLCELRLRLEALISA